MSNELLNSLSTEDLLTTCLDYPLLGDIMAFNNSQDGIDSYRNNFNGVREFFSRPDCASILINKYSSIDPSDFDKNWSLHSKGEFSFVIMVMEFLLSQEEVIQAMTESKKKEVVNILLTKRDRKQDKEVFGQLSHMSIYYAIIRVILSEHDYLTDVENEDIIKFSQLGNLNYSLIIPRINELALEFIK